jgi:hypothetical protein
LKYVSAASANGVPVAAPEAGGCLLGGALLLRQLGAAAKRLGWIVAHLDPLIFVADTVGAVLVLLLRSTNNDNMRFNLVVDRNGGTAVSPRPPDLDVLVQREPGLSHEIPPFCLILRNFRLTLY